MSGVSSAKLFPSFNQALTVHDGTNDLMNLAIFGGIGTLEALGDRRKDGFGLECPADGAAESRGAQARSGDAATSESVPSPMAPSSSTGDSDVLLQHLEGDVMGCGGSGELEIKLLW